MLSFWPMMEKECNSQDKISHEEEQKKKDLCSLSDKVPLFLLDQPSISLEKSLPIREQLLASRRVKAIGRQMRKWVEYRIHEPNFTSSHETNLGSEGELLIERVIKYLADR